MGPPSGGGPCSPLESEMAAVVCTCHSIAQARGALAPQQGTENDVPVAVLRLLLPPPRRQRCLACPVGPGLLLSWLWHSVPKPLSLSPQSQP